MPATITTLSVLDAAGTTRDIRAVDVSGTGAGPYIFHHTLANAAGVAHDSSNPVSVSIAAGGIAAGTGTTRSADVLTTTAVPHPQASGATATRVVSAATTNATSIKGTAGNLVNVDLFNVAAYDVFVKLYNKASAPTVGTDTPVWTVPIKAGQGYARTFQLGKSFPTGIALAITKLQADSDTTAVAAGDVTGAIDWI
jgi:hypothetical protein